MRLDAEILALRSDPASQRRIEGAMAEALIAWRSDDDVAKVIAGLVRYADREPLDCISALHALLTDFGEASRFVASWTKHFGAVLAQEHLSLIPFRHNYAPGLATMQLAAIGDVSLSLVAYEERETAIAPQSALFADRCQHEIVIGGAATGTFHNRNAASGAIMSEQICWQAGDRIHLVDSSHSRQITSVKGRFCVLQLVRGAVNPEASCEYRLSDGTLLHQACADKLASQAEMALAVLGEMGRADAAPVMADVSQKEGPAHLRWEAIRQTLALDPLIGIAQLTQIANRTSDDLHQPAFSLLNQLRHSHPHLFKTDQQPCPA